MIEIQNLTRQFGDFHAVKNISFRIDPSSGITALLGPNGAGKTTTMRMITGYYRATSGSIQICGMPLTQETSVDLKHKIGYLPESSPVYPEMLVSEFLSFSGSSRGLKGNDLTSAVDKMTELFELGSHLYSPAGILSKGFRQRLALAGALIHNPEVIILDEPTSGLDPNQISHIRTILKELGREKTFILSTHILQEVEDICERVIIMNRGEIAADEKLSKLKKGSGVILVARSPSVSQTLKKLKYIDEVHDQGPAGDGFTRYLCELTAPSEVLFADVAKEKWEVREFRPVSRSLQEIFEELTH